MTMRNRSVAIVLFALLSGCEPHLPGRPDPANKFVSPNQVLDFELLFSKNCVGCHGADGSFGPGPPLNDPIFQAIVSDDELTRVVTSGRAGTPMPAFAKEQGGTLTTAQIAALVKGMRAKWRDPKISASDWPAYQSAAAGDIERGKTLFAVACAGCHGADGKGDKKGGAINQIAVLGLTSNQELRRLIITGRADLGMPNSSGKTGRGPDFVPLTSGDVDDLVAYLRSWAK